MSDASLAELHAFAGQMGIPPRAFSGDHYDVPAERYPDAVAAGAEPVEGKVLLARLVASGLRVPKRRGERLLDSHRERDWLPPGGPGVLDLIASQLSVRAQDVVARRLVAQDGEGRLLLTPTDPGWALPQVPDVLQGGLRRLGFHRLRLDGHAPDAYTGPHPWAYVVYLSPATDTSPPEVVGATWVDTSDPAVHRLAAWPLVRTILDGR